MFEMYIIRKAYIDLEYPRVLSFRQKKERHDYLQ